MPTNQHLTLNCHVQDAKYHIAVLLMFIGYLDFVFMCVCVCVLFVFIRAAVSAGYFSFVVPATLVADIHCVSIKNTPDIFHCNSSRRWILITFGRNIS